jgi:hypothetical protein
MPTVYLELSKTAKHVQASYGTAQLVEFVDHTMLKGGGIWEYICNMYYYYIYTHSSLPSYSTIYIPIHRGRPQSFPTYT